MGLLLALVMMFTLSANAVYAVNLSEIKLSDAKGIYFEDAKLNPDELDPNLNSDEDIEPAKVVEPEAKALVEGDNLYKAGDALELGEERVPGPVGEPAGTGLGEINTIAKDKDGNFYGVRTYGNDYDDTSIFKTYYRLTEDQYNEVAAKCFMIFKRKDGEPFKLNGAKMSTLSIDEDHSRDNQTEALFTEMQFLHHMAYRMGFDLNNQPYKVRGQEDLTWYIELKKDWVIEPRPGYSDNEDPDEAYALYNVEIDGKGHKIYRNDDKSKGIFQLGSGLSGSTAKVKTANIKNLSIEGSGKYFGIYVYQKGILNLENVKIENCHADRNHSYYGGAIRLDEEASLTMDANTIISNCSAERGGGIRLLGKNTLTINGSKFINNAARIGGAICTTDENSAIKINGAKFEGNQAYKTDPRSSTFGGAIYTNSDINIKDTDFEGNSSVDYGGAIASYGNTTISGGKFTGNLSADKGGAIYQGDPKKLSIDGAVFKNNFSYTGGAVYQTGQSELTVKNSEFTDNGLYVDQQGPNYCQQGGAVYINSNVKASAEETKFSGNKASSGGGAIFISNGNPNEVVISNCYIERNSSVYGGGIYVNINSKLKVEDSNFINNDAFNGGAISTGAGESNTSKLTIDNCTFDINIALQGGGVFTAFPTEIKGSTFTKNEARLHPRDDKSNPHISGTGGAVYVIFKKTDIEGCTFTENNAYGSGGAISINAVNRDNNNPKKITTLKDGVKVNVKGATVFEKNYCLVGQGGAIHTIPYSYDLWDQAAQDENEFKAAAYKNLSTAADTVFKGNWAMSGFFNPPTNYMDYKDALQFARNSFTDIQKNEDLAKSLLNNFDVNYKNEKVYAYFDPNGGELINEANPRDIKVIEKDKIKENGEDKGADITILQAPKRDGYKFLGWKGTSLIPEAKLSEFNDEVRNLILTMERMYDPSETVNIKSNFLFIAQWDKADTPAPRPSTKVILTLDENHRGGEITNIEVEVGDLIEPHLYIPRRRGYTFRGWSYDQKHLDEVKPGDRIYSDTTLYAIWKRAEEEKVEEPEEIKGEDHKAYIFGYPNGTVRPNGSITRAEAAAMLARLLNIEAIGSAAKPNFTDTDSSWYNKAINAVVFRGIMKGYPDGRFRPNAPITRAEFTQMISTIDNKPYGVAPFADVTGHWAERAIGSEYQAKRITGYPDGLFRPDANITRAEAAVILNKIFERKYDNLSLLKCKNPQMIKRFTDLDESFWGWNDLVEATNSHEFIRRYKDQIMNRLEEDWLLIKDINDIK